MGIFHRPEKKTDAELMLRLQRGDRTAFPVLYDRYAGRLCNFFLRMMDQDSGRAQDLTHDLFLKIIEEPGRYDPERRFDTWIFHIAYNMCKNEYRREESRNEYRQRLGGEEPFTAESAHSRHDERIFTEALDRQLKQLDERHRMVFLLRYQQELPLREIAEILGCPEGTVKSRLFTALKALSAKLTVFDPRIN
jgi:RNA polymerase sigma-70 factor, ECF subfamily